MPMHLENMHGDEVGQEAALDNEAEVVAHAQSRTPILCFP